MNNNDFGLIYVSKQQGDRKRGVSKESLLGQCINDAVVLIEDTIIILRVFVTEDVLY